MARDFRGHTEYLAARCGLERYGRDYLMTFLAPDLTVALLSTHLPLRAALDRVTPEAIHEALRLLGTPPGAPPAGRGRLAVAPSTRTPARTACSAARTTSWFAPASRRRGPRASTSSARSPPTRCSPARASGEFDGVLALYHDQGLIAVKTAAFGQATNWTLGLPFLRTSVDHGTAFEIAGRDVADPAPLAEVIRRTLALLDG